MRVGIFIILLFLSLIVGFTIGALSIVLYRLKNRPKKKKHFSGEKFTNRIYGDKALMEPEYENEAVKNFKTGRG